MVSNVCGMGSLPQNEGTKDFPSDYCLNVVVCPQPRVMPTQGQGDKRLLRMALNSLTIMVGS